MRKGGASPLRRTVAVAIVLAFHALLYLVLLSGATHRIAEPIAAVTEVALIEEIVPEKPELAPPEVKLAAPSMPVMTMPEIAIEPLPAIVALAPPTPSDSPIVAGAPLQGRPQAGGSGQPGTGNSTGQGSGNPCDVFLGHYQLGLDTFIEVSRNGKNCQARTTTGRVGTLRANRKTFIAPVGGASLTFDPAAPCCPIFQVAYEGTDWSHLYGIELGARRVDAAVVRTAEAALARRLTAQQPDPERERLLRQYIEADARGEIPTDIMSPEMIANVMENRIEIRERARRMGKIQSLKFVGADVHGDAYLAKYTGGEIMWNVLSLTVDHKLWAFRLGKNSRP